jgi:hypothetical protein
MLKKPWSSLTLLLFLSVPLLLGDVVELKTGERLEGAFKQATSAGVVIEVGGQAINMPLAKVRAIYFGSAPVAGAQVPAVDAHTALAALRALNSATDTGLGYKEYSRRALDTKVKVDQYLRTSQGDTGMVRRAIRLAMRFHELSLQAWNANIAESFGTGAALEAQLMLGKILYEDKEIRNCPGLVSFLGADAKHPNDAQMRVAAAFAGQKPGVLWHCAAGKIAEAERLMK